MATFKLDKGNIREEPDCPRPILSPEGIEVTPPGKRRMSKIRWMLERALAFEAGAKTTYINPKDNKEYCQGCSWALHADHHSRDCPVILLEDIAKKLGR